MKNERTLKRLRQFIFYIEHELDDSSHLIPVLFSGTVRLFLQNRLVKTAIIVCDKLSYTKPNDVNVNYEEIESLLKNIFGKATESIQGFIEQYQILEGVLNYLVIGSKNSFTKEFVDESMGSLSLSNKKDSIMLTSSVPVEDHAAEFAYEK